MDALLLKTHSVLLFPSFSAFRNRPKLKEKHSVFSKDIVENISFTNPRRLLVFPASIIRFKQSTRFLSLPTGSFATGEGDDEHLHPQTSNSLRKRHLIALLERIQSSISQEEGEPKRSYLSESEDASPTEAILKVLHRSKSEEKESCKKQEDKKLRTRRGSPRKEQERADDPSPVMEFKLARPQSSFVKKSPIPYPTAPRGNVVGWSSKALLVSGAVDDELQPPSIQKMKLSELKKLAKERGIKGSSRMKKSELVDMLTS